MEDSGIDSDPKPVNNNEDERLFQTSDSSSSSGNQIQSVQKCTTKQLHKKLEARIEQAKRIQRNSEYIKLPCNEKNIVPSSSSGLISIQRLPIPHKNNEHFPLVEYWQSDTESGDETTLFPICKDNGKHKQDLTDTFSIEEMEMSEEGSEDSLHLGPKKFTDPHTRTYTPNGCFDCNNCQIL